MAIAFDNVGSTDGGTNQSYTVTIVVAGGSNRYLQCGVSIVDTGGGPTSVSSISSDLSGAFTFRYRDVFVANDHANEVWEFINPAVGTHTVTVTLVAVPVQVSATGCLSFSGVHQTTPIEVHATAHGAAAANPSVTLTTIADNAWGISIVTDNAPDDLTPTGSTGTQRWELLTNRGKYGSTSGALTPAGSKTFSYTGQISDWIETVVSIQPAAAADGAKNLAALGVG